ncbi:MAG: hypothetical protein H6988_01670 [Pseudomonadales bacterium]|nr:hypothetical protein [Halieaceae bacterium]MCP5165084.1 hypothetical protein [Pseudomonadales bacterium]MCP5189077.1 hypothetical protein [Pseudomonadales bacterium]
MVRNKVFIISDYTDRRAALVELVTGAGLDAAAVDSWEGWSGADQVLPAGCLVLSVAAGGLTCPERIALCKAMCTSYPVLVLTEVGDVPTAVEAMRQGAFHVMQVGQGQYGILQRIRQMLEYPAGSSV